MMAELTQTHEQTARTVDPTAKKGIVYLLVLVAIGIILGFFVLQNRSQEGPLVPTEAPIPISVETVQVNLEQAFLAEEKFTGIVTAKRISQLGFSSGGQIDALLVDIGDRVEAGARLALLDTRSLRAQLASANAVVTEAKAAYDLAEATVDRQIALLQKGHVSGQVVDEARAQANTAYARIDAAQANADTLRVQIDLASIKAPYAGTVTARMADEGAIAGAGQPIFELVETGALEARIGLTAAVAGQLSVGETYRLLSDQGTISAELRSITGVIDAGNRTVTSVFDILEPESVSAGAVVRLGMEREIGEPGLWLPVSALAEADRGLWSVYLARGQSGAWVAEPGIVEIIHQEGDRVYVRGAIRDGDLVVLDGLQRITPGQPVTPVQARDDSLFAGNG